MKRVHARAALSLDDGALRIAAVADTHSRPHPAIHDRLREIAPHHILHAGDIGDLAVLRALEKHAPITAVRGNIDERAADLPDVVTIDVREDDKTRITLLLLHIAVNGTKLRADVARVAKTEDASLVVCGHSHVPFAAHDKGVTVFNPGSIGPKRFALPIVLGVIEIARTGVSVRHIECDTGRAWPPPR